MTKFKNLRVKFGIGRERKERIKVAILDTGIDYSHSDVQKQRDRIADCKSFTGGEARVDNSGHGTHIAGTLLDLTNNTDLYIGKVIESRKGGGQENAAVRRNLAKVTSPSPAI